MMKQVAESWIRLMPRFEDGENGDERVGWNLVINLDNDWQDWNVNNEWGSGMVTFSFNVTDEMTAQLNPVPIYEVTGPDEEPDQSLKPKELIDAQVQRMRAQPQDGA
jgi:hypothetical protein